MKKPYNDSLPLRNSCARIHSSGVPPKDYRQGDVATPLGIVSVYSQRGDSTLTRLDFCHEGKLYMRTFNREFTDRGLCTVALRFAQDVTGNR